MSKLVMKGKRDYSNNWVPVVLSGVSLLLMILGGVGFITPEQTAALGPLLHDTISTLSLVIAGVIQIINTITKPVTPTV